MLAKQICGIYKIISPSKKIYIGRSVDILKRWKGYKNLRCKQQTKLYHSFIKHGVEKHKFEILCECDKNRLNKLEKYYVDLYNTFNSNYGLNVLDGGSYKTILKETKEKIRQKLKGRKRTPESIIKCKETILKNGGVWNKGKTGIFSKIALKKIGHRHSDESYKKSANKRKGRRQTEEHKLKNSKGGKLAWIKRKIDGKSTHTQETKEKIRQSLLGKKLKQEHIEKAVHARKMIRQERLTMIF